MHQNRAIPCGCGGDVYRFPAKSRDFLGVKVRDLLAIKNASARRFSLWLKRTKMIPTAGIPVIPESAMKIASEWRCAILVRSASAPCPSRVKFVPVWPEGIFQGGGMCIFWNPPRQEFYTPPPSFMHPPPLEGYFHLACCVPRIFFNPIFVVFRDFCKSYVWHPYFL